MESLAEEVGARKGDAPGRAPSLERRREAWQLQLIADPDLPESALRVAVAITWHMNRNKGGLAWPGIQRLATLTGLHRTTVMRAIKWLESRGHLRVVRSHTGGKRGANRYLPLLKSMGSQAAHSQPDDAPGMRLGSRTLTHVNSPTAMRPEPLKEPLNEPLSQSAAVGTAADKKGAGEEGKIQEETPRAPRPPHSSVQPRELTP